MTSPSPSRPEKRRFIAGAKCPACHAMDTLVLYIERTPTERECVACGFRDTRPQATAPKELDTRVNSSEAQRAEETAPLKWLAPP